MRDSYLVFIALTLVVSSSLSQIPRTIGYQGVLTDSLGNPKPDGNYSMTFRLYDIASGGIARWEETKAVTVKSGLFSTNLGDHVAIGAGVQFDKRYWLGVSVSGGAELVPRLSLNATPYSLNALAADSARYVRNAPSPGGTAGGDLAGTYPNPTIAANAVTEEKILDGSVTSDDIQDMARTIHFTALSINYPASSSVITQAISSSGAFTGGLSWTFANIPQAHLPMPRPADWDGVSDITIKIWFTTTTATSGTVTYYVRPRTYASGDAFLDVLGIYGTPVSVSGGPKIYEHSVTIPAARFGTKPYWDLAIQREVSTATYPDPVVVSSINVSYTAIR